MKRLIERQVIATWHTPEEKLPEDDRIVLITISSKGRLFDRDHELTTAKWFGGSTGWLILAHDCKEFTVHAWCDIEPYGG